MQSLKQTFLTGYNATETVCAYLVTGWFSFGGFLAYLMFTQQLGRNYLPELFYLVLLSLVMIGTFPFFVIVYNGFNGVDAIVQHDYPSALLSFSLALGVLFAWYGIRCALYGRPRKFLVSSP